VAEPARPLLAADQLPPTIPAPNNDPPVELATGAAAPPPLPASEPPSPAIEVTHAPAPVDPQIVTTAAAAAPSPEPTVGDDAVLLNEQVNDDSKLVGLTVAMANGQPITLRRLKEALNDWKATSLPPGQSIGSNELNQIVPMLLDFEIDRVLLNQEARRRLLDNDKKIKAFNDFADQQFDTIEMPRLMRKNDVKTPRELHAKLEAKGHHLSEYRDKFRQEVLSQEYLREALKTRLTRPELPALWAYYRAHPEKYRRAAQVTWREIVVKCADETPAQRIAARKKAEALLTLLRQGQDFAEVARTQSQGPTAAKGGQWITEPGASAVPAVDTALESLPLNQPSSILEGPASFHIVRIDGRREAGLTPFVEVQGAILTEIQSEQFQRETEAYLADLRARSVVITRYRTNRSPRSDPQALRTAGP
jgi:parvulin-like peptidyl-prolyl isomerase